MEEALLLQDRVNGELPSQDMRRSIADQQKDLEELANLAASYQVRDLPRFSKPTFHFHESEGLVGRAAHFSAGPIIYKILLEVPQNVIHSKRGTQGLSEISNLAEQYEAAKQDASTGAIRFLCGRLWYTLKQPLTVLCAEEARKNLELVGTSTTEQIKKNLHFRFQRIFRKPPDDWTETDVSEWNILLQYLDLEAYQSDNPPIENRIGRLIQAEPDRVIIRWNTAGEIAYDSRIVPPEIIATVPGWLIHAEFQMTGGTEIWLSTRIAPPIESDTQIMEEDTVQAAMPNSLNIPSAVWPKIQD